MTVRKKSLGDADWGWDSKSDPKIDDGRNATIILYCLNEKVSVVIKIYEKKHIFFTVISKGYKKI